MTRLLLVLAVRTRCARDSPHSVGTTPRNWHMSCGVSATSTCSTGSTPAPPCPGFTSACNPRRREILKSGRLTSHEEPSPGFCDLIGGNYVEGSAKLDRHPATPSSTRYGLPRSNSDTEPNWPSRCWARPPVEPPAAPKTSKQSSETITIPSPPSSGWNRSPRTARRGPALSLEARRPMRVAINSNRDSNGNHAWDRLNSRKVTGWLQ